MWQQGALRDGSRSPPGVHQLHGDAVRVQVSTPDPGHALAPHEAAAGSQGITTTRAGPDGLPPQKGSRMQSPLMLTTRAADRLLDKGLAWFDGKGALLAYGTPYHWDAAQQCYVDLARLQAQREAALAPPPSPEVQAVQAQTRLLLRLAQYGLLVLIVLGNLPLGALAVVVYVGWRLSKL